MPTVKLVVIGASGVGKTSLRSQYISGQFSNGYRATIGADFIAKSLPHPTKPEEKIILQIWDTAGQERFSSLSSAFFRGADAALLLFDVNSPATLQALTNWWADFRERAPLADEDVEDFCCVVVGNKMDLSGGEDRVTETVARNFLEKLIPSTSSSPSSTSREALSPLHEAPPSPSSRVTMRPSNTVDESPTSLRHASPLRSDSIAITIGQNMGDNSRSSISRSPPHNLIKSRSTSRFYTGTMTTSHTTLTVYHTPSSSLFDIFQSARSSPEPWSSPPLSPSSSLQISNSPFASHRGRRSSTQSTSTTGTTSSSSGVTITPSLFAREQSSTTPATTVMADPSVAPVDFEQDPFTFAVFPPPPPRGPKLFFTSAKTGEGVPDIFEYIARRVVRRWEYEERLELRRLHYREPTDENLVDLTFWQKAEERTRTACCGS